MDAACALHSLRLSVWAFLPSYYIGMRFLWGGGWGSGSLGAC